MKRSQVSPQDTVVRKRPDGTLDGTMTAISEPELIARDGNSRASRATTGGRPSRPFARISRPKSLTGTLRPSHTVTAIFPIAFGNGPTNVTADVFPGKWPIFVLSRNAKHGKYVTVVYYPIASAIRNRFVLVNRRARHSARPTERKTIAGNGIRSRVLKNASGTVVS